MISRTHKYLTHFVSVGPKIKYIKGESNTVADALSRLNFSPSGKKQQLFCKIVKNLTKVENLYTKNSLDTSLFSTPNLEN